MSTGTSAAVQAATPPTGYTDRFHRILAGLSLRGDLAQLPPRAVAVLVAVLVRLNFKRGGVAWPSLADLCARTGLGKDTVIKALGELEAAELLIRVRSSGKVTRYVAGARLRELEGCDPWANHQAKGGGRAVGGRRRVQAQPVGTGRHEPKEVPFNLPERNNQQCEDAGRAANASNGSDVVASPKSLHEGEDRTAIKTEGVAASLPHPSEAPSSPSSAVKTTTPNTGKVEQLPTPEQRLPVELYRELVELGVHQPGRLTKYGEGRVREALSMLNAAQKAGKVQSAPRWLVACLHNGWTPDPKKAAQPFGEDTLKQREDAQRREQERQDPNWQRRSNLGRLASRCLPSMPPALRRRPEDLADQLAVVGLTVEDLVSYLAELAESQ